MILRKNQKSQIGTFLPYLLIGMIIILIFFVVAIPVAYMNDEIADALQDNLDMSESTNQTVQDFQDRTTAWFDQVVFFIIIAFIIGAIVIAIFTDYHPVVLGVMILTIVLLVVIAGLFSNVTNEVATNEVLADKAAEFTFTNSLMGTQLPIVILIVGVISVIILLAKRGGATSQV